MENRVSKVYTYAIIVAILLLITSALIVLPQNFIKAEAAREDYFEFSEPIIHEGTILGGANYYSSYVYAKILPEGNINHYQAKFYINNSIKGEIPTEQTQSYGVIWIDGSYYDFEQTNYKETENNNETYYTYYYAIDLKTDSAELNLYIEGNTTIFEVILNYDNKAMTSLERWELIYLAFPTKRIYNNTDLGQAAQQGRMEGYDKKEAEAKAYYEPQLEDKFNDGYEIGIEDADSRVNKNSESYKQGTYDVNVSLNTIVGNTLSSIGDFIMTILSIEVAGISLWAILAAIGGIILIGIIIKLAI